jgi:hypothetical protein
MCGGPGVSPWDFPQSRGWERQVDSKCCVVLVPAGDFGDGGQQVLTHGTWFQPQAHLVWSRHHFTMAPGPNLTLGPWLRVPTSLRDHGSRSQPHFGTMVPYPNITFLSMVPYPNITFWSQHRSFCDHGFIIQWAIY